MQPQPQNHDTGRGSAAAAVVDPEGRRGTLELLKRYYEGRQHLRRGICLLNAGQYDQAAASFAQAERANPNGRSLASLMTANRSGDSPDWLMPITSWS